MTMMMMTMTTTLLVRKNAPVTDFLRYYCLLLRMGM